MMFNVITTCLNSFLRAPISGIANVIGLATGFVLIFIVSSFAAYERQYDGFFERADRIFAVYPVFTPDGPLPVRVGPTAPAAARSLFADLAPVETTASVFAREYRVRSGDQLAYQHMRFVDPGFFEIFDLDFVVGARPATPETTDWVVLSETAAARYFGAENALNRVLDAQRTMTVVGVYRDLPRDSHFSSSLIGEAHFEMIAATALLRQLTDQPLDQDWFSLSTDDSTYVLLRSGAQSGTLDSVVDGRVEDLVPERAREMFETFRLRPLAAINLYPSEAVGLPLLAIVQGLAALVLFGTVLNYSNIATAQAFSRFREAAVRRTLGALRRDIAAQTFGESIIVVLMSTTLAVGASVYVLFIINAALDRQMPFIFVTSPVAVLVLIGIVLLTALSAAIIPIFYLVRLKIVDVFRQASQRDGGALMRGAMVAVQTGLAVILTAIALVASLQFQSVNLRTGFFDRSRMIVLDRYPEAMRGRYEALKRELGRVPGVERVAGASFVPFQLIDENIELGRVRGGAEKYLLRHVSADEDWLEMFGLRVMSGRALDRTRDEFAGAPGDEVSLVINETSARLLGWASATDALNQLLYRQSDGQTYRIVGVVGDENIAGALAAVPPLALILEPSAYREIAITLAPDYGPATLQAVEAAWASIYPDFPVHWKTMDELHGDTHSLLAAVSAGISGLAILAIGLSAYGMLSLAKLLVRRREREIAIRKTLGASRGDVFGLLLWSFSKPIIIAMAVGLPISFLLVQLYLDLFAEAVRIPPAVILLIPIFFATLTVLMVLGQAWSAVSRPAAISLGAE